MPSRFTFEQYAAVLDYKEAPGGYLTFPCPVPGHHYANQGAMLRENEDGSALAKCFAQCDWRDLYAALDALVVEQLGSDAAPIPRQRSSFADREEKARKHKERQRYLVAHVLTRARPITSYTRDYLKSRGLDPAPLAPLLLEYELTTNDELCGHFFKDELRQKIDKKVVTHAMVARLTGFENDECDSVQLTFLRFDQKVLRRNIGPRGGRAIKLSGTGVPPQLLVAEGFETAATALQRGWVPAAWSLGYAAAFSTFPVLPQVKHLIIARENDLANAENVKVCRRKYTRAGVRAQYLRAVKPGANDLNDVVKVPEEEM